MMHTVGACEMFIYADSHIIIKYCKPLTSASFKIVEKAGDDIAYSANSFIKVSPATDNRVSTQSLQDSVKCAMYSKSRAHHMFTE